MSDKLAAFQAATAAITKETPREEALRLLNDTLPLLLDMNNLEEERAFEDLAERCSLSKKMLQAFRKDLKEARKKPPDPAPDTGPTPEEELKELAPLAAPLAASPDIIGDVVKALQALGVAGQEREAKTLYMALTTRIWERPVNVAVKGQSSGGKSFTVESVLKLFPAQAFHALSAMSEKALAYSQEPLSHRFLVIYEAAGLGSDFAQYLMRSLLSEGRVRYETVEKTQDGLKPRLIEREGPTGLIVTTTKAGLHPENETRMLSLEVDDSPEQTRAVLLAQADPGRNGNGPDLAPFHALQRILEITRPEVLVPFARPLAAGCDAQAVRLRRDFPTVLSLVKAHAALHGAHRQRDPQGRIIAELQDYSAVYDLVADLIAHGTGAKVNSKVRDLVAVVERIADEEGITCTKAATEMGIHKATALRLARKALKGEFLINKETRKGQPARLIVGDPIPPDGAVLPLPEKIMRQYPPENDATAQPKDVSAIVSNTSRLHTAMQPLCNRQPEFQSELHGCTPVAPPSATDNQLINLIKDGAVAGLHGFQGDKQKTFFEDDKPVTPDASARELEL